MSWDNSDLQACADALTTITRERGIPLVNLISTFTLKPDLALYVADGLHPGPTGHRIIIEKVLDTINHYS
jgi:lysophospholipase L1-like esterase